MAQYCFGGPGILNEILDALRRSSTTLLRARLLKNVGNDVLASIEQRGIRVSAGRAEILERLRNAVANAGEIEVTEITRNGTLRSLANNVEMSFFRDAPALTRDEIQGIRSAWGDWQTQALNVGSVQGQNEGRSAVANILGIADEAERLRPLIDGAEQAGAKWQGNMTFFLGPLDNLLEAGREGRGVVDRTLSQALQESSRESLDLSRSAFSFLDSANLEEYVNALVEKFFGLARPTLPPLELPSLQRTLQRRVRR